MAVDDPLVIADQAFDLMRQVPYHQRLRTQFVEIRYDAGAGTGAGAQPMGLFTHIEKLGGKSYLERRGWVARAFTCIRATLGRTRT